MREKPYRVVVWGPGNIGRILIREVLEKPEFELIGVLAYSQDKDGMDAGELVGAGPSGVRMSTDQEAIFSLQPDVVLLTAQTTAPVGLGSHVADVTLRWLRSGVNVVSAPAYHWPTLEGPELGAALEAACRDGGATLHSTGINPGLLNERWLPALTAVCTSIDHIKVQELSNIKMYDSKNMVLAIGFGQEPRYDETPIVMKLGDRYYGETLHHACHTLGVELERIERSYEWIVADKDYEMLAIDVPKGTINGVIMRFTAIVEGRPFLTLEEIFYGNEAQAPIEVTSDSEWTILVEGKPTSLYAKIDMKASIVEDRYLHEGDPTRPSSFATAVAMIQAVPVTVAAEPGILFPSTFTNFRPDLRGLESGVGATTG